MPGAEIRAICNQIIGEAKAISAGAEDLASLRVDQAIGGEGADSVVADHLESLGLTHLENIQQLVILLTATMTVSAEGDGGDDGSGGGDSQT